MQPKLVLAKRDDVIYNNQPRVGVKIAIKSLYDETAPFEYYTIKEDTEVDTLLQWIYHNHLWLVLEEKKDKWEINL